MLKPNDGLIQICPLIVGINFNRRQRLVVVNQRPENLAGILQAHHSDVAGWIKEREPIGAEDGTERQVSNVQRIGPARCSRVLAVSAWSLARRMQLRRAESFTSHWRRNEVKLGLIFLGIPSKIFQILAIWRRHMRCGTGTRSARTPKSKTCSSASSRARCIALIARRLAWCTIRSGTWACRFLHNLLDVNLINVSKCSLLKMFWTVMRCLIVMWVVRLPTRDDHIMTFFLSVQYCKTTRKCIKGFTIQRFPKYLVIRESVEKFSPNRD